MGAGTMFVCFLLLTWKSLAGGSNNGTAITMSPPRGWNSYDSFGWVVGEDEFLANANIVSKRLLKHGYKYVIVDFLWYRRNVDGASRDSYGYDVLDQWGRLMPDPERWPSSRGGKGFTHVARKVHDMGLKFGIHLMRGISTQAVNANTPVLDVAVGRVFEEDGRPCGAKDIGLTEKKCAWMKNGFMSVNMDSMAGRAFLRSLYTQYAEWGVDFVKLDCVFGDDLDVKEITLVSELLQELDRFILLSISPGTNVNVDMAKLVNDRVNMYRITADDWDSWSDIAAHFDIASDFAASHMIGAMGKSWPDLDMLPLGWLTNSYGNGGPYRKCNLTLDEQRSQITLWSIARSPIIFGGDLRNIDDTTFQLITNPTILEINSFSRNNMEMWKFNDNGSLTIEVKKGYAKEASQARAWIATGRNGEVYLAIFNLNSNSQMLSAKMQDISKALPGSLSNNGSCDSKEVWTRRHFGVVAKKLSISVPGHGCALVVLNCRLAVHS